MVLGYSGDGSTHAVHTVLQYWVQCARIISSTTLHIGCILTGLHAHCRRVHGHRKPRDPRGAALGFHVLTATRQSQAYDPMSIMQASAVHPTQDWVSCGVQTGGRGQAGAGTRHRALSGRTEAALTLVHCVHNVLGSAIAVAAALLTAPDVNVDPTQLSLTPP